MSSGVAGSQVLGNESLIMSLLPRPGEVVDEVFRVEAELGHGNFGAVYRVYDLLEGRTLALKVLKPSAQDEQQLRERFEREARLIYSLEHPHVLRVFYYGQTANGLPYLAMEFLEGTDLRTLLAHHGPMSPRLVKRIALETLSALEAAHALGIIHRDLKPANIFLVNDGARGHVKVLDFGFAKAMDSDASDELTAAKTLVGTPAYMSPELVHKKHVGPPADIYALGLIMAEMITGEKVVQIESIYDTIMFQASMTPLKLPAKVNESIFGAIIARAVDKNVATRYQLPAEMIRDLEALGGDTPRGAQPTASIVGYRPGGNSAQATVNGYQTGAYALAGGLDDALTAPKADGHPSMQHIEAALGAGAAHSIDPFADYPAYEDSDPTLAATTADFTDTAQLHSHQLTGAPLPAIAHLADDDLEATPPPAHLSGAQAAVAPHAQQSVTITQPSALPQPTHHPPTHHGAQMTFGASLPGRAHEFSDPSWAQHPVDFSPTTEFDRSAHALQFAQFTTGAHAPITGAHPAVPAQPAAANRRREVLKEVLIGAFIGGGALGLFLIFLHFFG